jgi:hypothetical protein
MEYNQNFQMLQAAILSDASETSDGSHLSRFDFVFVGFVWFPCVKKPRLDGEEHSFELNFLALSSYIFIGNTTLGHLDISARLTT